MFTVESLTYILNQLLPEPHAGLLVGLLFGTKSTLSQEFYYALITTGTLHIIALSGMNISIIMDMIAKMLQWRTGRRGASLISVAIIVWFVWFVGPSSSIVRAAIMGSISLIAVIFGREYWALLSWMLAVGIMLLLNFSWISDISFQLSALATLGIILFGNQNEAAGKHAFSSSATRRKLETGSSPTYNSQDKSGGNHFEDNYAFATGVSRLIRICKRVFSEEWEGLYVQGRKSRAGLHKLVPEAFVRAARDSLHLTLAAQVFTIPLILFHFHRISFVSPLANLAIGWIVAPLTMLGWVTAVAGWIFLPLGTVFAWGAWVLLEYMIRVIYIVSAIPMASFGW